MKIGILGTGMVGSGLGGALAERGHGVMMGGRSADNVKAREWASKAGSAARTGTFADAVCNTDSLGEQPGEHNLFMAGNDDSAKQQVQGWLGEWFGWKPEQIIDLGEIIVRG